MGEKGVGKLSRETSPPREGEPMGASAKGVPENSTVSQGNGLSGSRLLLIS